MVTLPRIVLAAAALTISAALGSSIAKAADIANTANKSCKVECVEEDAGGRCIRTEAICPPSSGCGSDQYGQVVGCPSSQKTCYECVIWYPNGECKGSKRVPCN